jgi:hypothetical protein
MDIMVILVERENETQVLGVFSSMERALMVANEYRKSLKQPRVRIAKAILGHTYDESPAAETLV